MQKLVIPAQFKALDDTVGTFAGVANRAQIVDLGGDRTMPGAFRDTLRRSQRRPLLWMHDMTEPIGEVELAEDRDGSLRVTNGRLVLGVQRAAELYALMKQAPTAVSAMSIGYETKRERFVGGVRELLEIDVFEVSLVVYPMNQDSRVESVKGSGELHALLNVLSGMRRGADVAELEGLARQLGTFNSQLRGAR